MRPWDSRFESLLDELVGKTRQMLECGARPRLHEAVEIIRAMDRDDAFQFVNGWAERLEALACEFEVPR